MKRFPIGIENFSEMIKDNYYYVDKTMLIKSLLTEGGKVTLFTRPRRFGKTLNMSMLKYFFMLGTEKSLFNGLKISEDEEFCNRYMGKYPVISITLKNVDGNDFEKAFYSFCNVMSNTARDHEYLALSEYLDDSDKELYREIVDLGNHPPVTAENIDKLSSSLIILMRLMKKHFGIPVVTLIDEYDVPLDKAHNHGYYDDMVGIIRNMFNMALKTNDSLAFGVMTGCLRVSKESIFTGMNNLTIDSITRTAGNETFGFTEQEVDELLSYYDLAKWKPKVKEWYDGYLFGDSEIYCPWDVVNFSKDIYYKIYDGPVSYWSNTSSNDLVREFVDIASVKTKSELEALVNGDQITKEIREELTYRDIDNTIENIWSILYLTGYLTGRRTNEDNNTFVLWIPNREVREIYEHDIKAWFQNKIRSDSESGIKFYKAALSGHPEEMTRILNMLLMKSVSIRDSFTKENIRENFYHGFVLGLLYEFDGINSNSENGEGYSDITIVDDDEGIVAILELKYSDSGDPDQMASACDDALKQIEDKRYADDYLFAGTYNKVEKYGISFHMKRAMVKRKEE